MKKKSGSGLAAMAAIIMLASLRAGAAPWVLIDATTNNGSFETPAVGPANYSGYNETYDVYWLWATPTSWETLGGNALITTKGTLFTGVTGNQFATLNPTGPWLAKTFSETYQTGSIYTLTADIGVSAAGVNVGIYFKGMQGTSEVASLGQTVTMTNVNGLHPMTNLVLDTAVHPEFIGKTIRMGFNLPGSDQGFVDNVNLSYVSLCANPSFEFGVSVPTAGYMAVPYWTQVPFPSGQPGVDYLSGLAITNNLGDNGLIPDGAEAAFIDVYNTVSTNSLQQTINGLTVGKLYRLQYYENARAHPSLTNPVLTVTMDGTTIVAPHVVTNVEAWNVHTQPFKTVQSAPFIATSNAMTLAFTVSQRPAGYAGTVLLDNLSVTEYEGGPVVQNPSFELGVDLPSSSVFLIPFWTQVPYPSGYGPAPLLTGVASSGLQDNGLIPDGTHVATVELYSTATSLALNQTVVGFAVGKTYQVQYYENARALTQMPRLTLKVDGATNVASHVVTNVEAYGSHTQPFRLVKGTPFTATSSAMTISFVAEQQTYGDDAMALLDMVTIVNIPCGSSFSFH